MTIFRHALRLHVVPILTAVFVLSSLTACGTFEVGIERTVLPDDTVIPTVGGSATETTGPSTQEPPPATSLPDDTATPTPYIDHWSTYSNPAYGISLQYPPDWQPVPGYGGGETGETRFAAQNGFFHVSAIDAASIDDAAASEAGHVLQPYGSRPIIENLQVQGQEARLILPSADQSAGMDHQAALIVSYPKPVNIAGHMYRYFVLWADQSHIRVIAQTLLFSADPAPTETATPAQPISWENLPPGLVYSAQDGLWLINADEQAVQIHNNPQAVLSPDGTRLLSYDTLQQDVWLINLTDGAIWNLTRTPDRFECCFRWWPDRPDVVVFYSGEEGAERGPGATGYLTAINLDGQGYRILDSEHGISPEPDQFALSPDGQTVAYGSGSTAWLYRWETGVEVFDPADYGLTGYEDVQIGHPAWSPDGTKLVWIVKGGVAVDGSSAWVGVGLFDLEARTAQVLHPHESQGVGWPSAPVWSPDGKWLAFSDSSPSDEAGLWVARADGWREEYHLGLGGNPVWSPDGEWLVFGGFLQDGPPAYMLAEVGAWNLRQLDVSPDRYGRLVDWINPSGMPK
ncbi:MAG: hypothetical protein SVX38_04680 [Chloroflexota bacterium]|nr:hypothetical protein [Chloroflexota bacterium]